MLDIKFNNICNLACKMCDPVSSSKLATEWKQLGWTDQNTPYLDTNSKTILPDWQNTNYQTNKINKIWDEIIDNIQFVKRIKFTGGEPFMNPDILEIIRSVLERGFSNLVLTNGMRPMMRPAIRSGLLKLNTEFSDKLTVRVSVDHFNQVIHEKERGLGSWAPFLVS